MPTEFIQIFVQFGLSGVVLFCAGWYIMKRDKNHDENQKDTRILHKEERAELVSAINRQHSEAMSTQRDTNGALQSLAGAVSDLSSLVRDRK